MQALPDAARALGDVGLIGARVMQLEVLVGAVAEELRRPGPKSVSAATNCSGVEVVVWLKWMVDMTCSLLFGVLRAVYVRASGDPSRQGKTLVWRPGKMGPSDQAPSMLG